MRAAGSVPDLLSPPRHVSEEPPPLPPERPEGPSPENPDVDVATHPPGFYDTPSGGEVGGGGVFYNTPPLKYPPPHQIDTAAASEEFYNVPPSTSLLAERDNIDGVAFYNTPPPAKYPLPRHTDSAAADFYNVPPSTSHLAEKDNVDGGACYDVPPTGVVEKQTGRRATKKKQTKVEAGEATGVGGELYNVPPLLHAAEDKSGSSSVRGEFYENVPTSGGGGKKSKKVLDAAGRSGLMNNEKSLSMQTASVCLADQTYDVPSAEQLGGMRQSVDTSLSTGTADETYDTPARNKILDKAKQQSPKKPIDLRPLTGISDQTYDTPPTTFVPSSVKTRPDKPVRGKLGRSSIESSLEAVENSAQETYDIPPTAQQPLPKPTVMARNLCQTAVPTDEMYDVPPPKSVTPSTSFDRSTGGMTQPEDQTYNVPASCVPPVPAKRNQAPPPKPPRPTGQ